MKVGDKAKGFVFKDETDGITWTNSIKRYLHEIGTIRHIGKNCFSIQFSDDWWNFPISLAHLSVVDEWQPKQGEMIEVSDNGKDWYEREFFAKIDRFNSPYIVIPTWIDSSVRYKHARPINTIQREIDELQAKIDELKKRL